MRMNSIFALIPIGIVAAVCCLSAADKPSGAASSLSSIKSFAFGGIGAAGTTSPGEALYRTVLDSSDALAQFRGILASGTSEAKLYALCGIHSLDPASFESAAAPLKKSNPTVETIGGCIIMKQPAAGVIMNIAKGQYDKLPPARR